MYTYSLYTWAISSTNYMCILTISTEIFHCRNVSIRQKYILIFPSFTKMTGRRMWPCATIASRIFFIASFEDKIPRYKTMKYSMTVGVFLKNSFVTFYELCYILTRQSEGQLNPLPQGAYLYFLTFNQPWPWYCAMHIISTFAHHKSPF
jgi:hypothetical protein